MKLQLLAGLNILAEPIDYMKCQLFWHCNDKDRYIEISDQNTS